MCFAVSRESSSVFSKYQYKIQLENKIYCIINYLHESLTKNELSTEISREWSILSAMFHYSSWLLDTAVPLKERDNYDVFHQQIFF